MAEPRNEDEYLDFYCPGCGKQAPVLSYCAGRGEAPHRSLLMVSTDEIRNQPNREENPEAFRKWAENHTAAPASE